MAKVAIQFEVELAQIDCGCCGGTYAINERYRLKQYEEGGSWTCPYCKVGWGYSNNNENAKLKRQLKEEQERKDRALAEANTLRFERDRAQETLVKVTQEAKRLKKRVTNGVCPCCTRSFQNLKRHMATKHPEHAQG